MKVFNVSKGVEVLMGKKGKDPMPFTTRKDLCFWREELVVDPVSINNVDTYALCKELEGKGHCNAAINTVMNNARHSAVFERDGYLLIVSFDKVTMN